MRQWPSSGVSIQTERKTVEQEFSVALISRDFKEKKSEGEIEKERRGEKDRSRLGLARERRVILGLVSFQKTERKRSHSWLGKRERARFG